MDDVLEHNKPAEAEGEGRAPKAEAAPMWSKSGWTLEVHTNTDTKKAYCR